MKIFLAGPLWNGQITEYSAKALKQLGCGLKVFYNSDIKISTPEERMLQFFPCIPFSIDEMVKRHLNNRIKWKQKVTINQEFIKQALAFSPDVLLLFIGSTNLIFADSVSLIKEKLKIPVVVWFIDEPSVFYENTKIVRQADHLFVIDPPLISQLKLLTDCPIGYLPNAADADIFKPVELSTEKKQEYGCEVGFVGAVTYNAHGCGHFRAAPLEFLSRKYRVKIYGNPTWKNLIDNDFPALSRSYGGRMLNGSETNDFYNAAEILLNIHHPSLKCGVNQRLFEIPAAGAFQLSDKKSEIEEFFEIGKEIICFDNRAELDSLVKYYLNHPDERREITQRARRKVLENHTYLHRMRTALSVLGC